MYEKKIRKTREGLQRVAGYLWDRGWAERNGGNISFRLDLDQKEGRDEDVVNSIKADLPEGSEAMALLISGTGKRMRDLASGQGWGLIRILKDNSGYDVLWSTDPDFRATSELPTHLMVHDGIDNEQRAVVHCHPTELIAVSHHHIYGYDEKSLTRKIWAMMPEIRIFLPSGISIVPYTLTGSDSLAELTVKSIRSSDVALWSMHGALATGKDIDDAFDKIDLANKGAEILLKCLCGGYEAVGIDEASLNELGDHFKEI